MTPSLIASSDPRAGPGTASGRREEKVMSPEQSWPLPTLPEAHLLIQFTGLFYNVPAHKMF